MYLLALLNMLGTNLNFYLSVEPLTTNSSVSWRLVTAPKQRNIPEETSHYRALAVSLKNDGRCFILVPTALSFSIMEMKRYIRENLEFWRLQNMSSIRYETVAVFLNLSQILRAWNSLFAFKIILSFFACLVRCGKKFTENEEMIIFLLLHDRFFALPAISPLTGRWKTRASIM